MQRRQLTMLMLGLGGYGLSPAAFALSESDAAQGVRAALQRGAEAALALLGKRDGFLGNPRMRIELPGFMGSAARLLKSTGQGRKVDELVTAMNRAAEAAVPQARTLLVNTAKSISVEDALQIVTGSETAVTEFFTRKTRAPLGTQFLPIVKRTTAEVSLTEKYNRVAGKAAGFGLMKASDADLPQYVTGKTLDALYLVIGEEEKKIRRDPIGTGSALLQKVFGR